ncbi:MAG TPA: putative hydro-lyase [Mycobacterium sp.]|nr:putative hydro-lyase [Mycobacterium sp.]
MALRTAESAVAARARIRTGEHAGPTSGLAPGFAQANLVVLPADYALDFLRFCVRNPRPCPLLEVTDTGSPRPETLAPDADLRTDLPRYRVFRDGALVDEPTDVTRYWREDLVGFLLGCSFTFEWALAAAGLPLAHQLQGVNVPMFVTNRRCVPAGSFEGPLVVSMRPFPPADIPRAVEVSARFPAMHGGPVHIGDPAALGIGDLSAPDFGDPVEIGPAEVPVFWACGVTPQAVALEARPSLAIFHAPGHMFITDRPHGDFDTKEMP